MFIYQIKNLVNGHCYYGKSTKTHRPMARWNEHRSGLRKNIHGNSHLQNAWNKYGEDVFNYSILEHTTTINLLNKLEARYIAKNDAVYNIREAGNRGFHSAETKQKMSETAKRITRTKEVRERRSNRMKAAWKDPEYRKMMIRQISIACKKQFKNHPELWEDRLKKANKASVNSCKRIVKVIDPEGNIHETTNGLSEFERKYNLTGLRAVVCGVRSHHKGWKLYENAN